MHKTLLIAGAVLMILGYLHGFVLDLTPNRALGLSAHVAAIQNGLIVLVLGGVWRFVNLSNRIASLTGWLCILGLYQLWLGLFCAAMMNLTSPLESGATSALQFGGSAFLLVGFLLLVYGFFKHTHSTHDELQHRR